MTLEKFLQFTAHTNPYSTHLWGTLAYAVMCRNDHCYASRAQKPHFCVKTTKNLGKIAHSDTRMPILCSKGRKMGVPKPKSAQKCRFCARRSTEPVRRGPARHGTTTRNGTRPPGTKRNGPKHNETQPQRNATQRNTRNATQHTQRNASATQLHNGEQQKRRQPFGLSPLKIGGYLLSHMVVQYHRRK